MSIEMLEPNERPPIAHAPLSMVLPACNVKADLASIVDGWKSYLDSLNRDYELVITDDGSSDRTGRLADELAAKLPRLKVIHHPTAQGFGAALRSGLAAAQLPLFFYGECTTAYQPQELGKLLEMIDHVDLVTGIRVWQQNRPAWSLGNWWSHLALRLVFGLRLKDVDCAFKLFRRSIFARIPIQSDGSFVHAEILAKANFLGCLIAEADVSYSPRADSGGDSAARRQRR